MLIVRLFGYKIHLYYVSKKQSVCNWLLGKWIAKDLKYKNIGLGYRILGISILIERGL